MRYLLVANTTVSLCLEVEADSLEDAMSQAKMAPTQSLCHQCSRGEPEEWHAELDVGSPDDFTLVEIHFGDDYREPTQKDLRMWKEA